MTRVGRLRFRLVAVFFLALGSGLGVALAVTPKNPEELKEREETEDSGRSPWLWWRIDELETERKQLASKRSRMPLFSPAVQDNSLGYHSAFEPAESEEKELPHTIRFSFPRRQFVQSIALAPAASPMGAADEAYAFPRRFRIEVRDSNSTEFETVVNWMDRDFPDPGAYPVFFSEVELWASEVRLTVPKWDDSGDYVYFALGEVYLFGGKPSQPLDNLALWAATQVEASSSFELARRWNLRYLRDRVNNLGFPVMSRQDRKGGDLLIVSQDGAELPETVEIFVDFSSIRRGVGRIDLWPAEPPNDLALMGYGFPEKAMIEFSVSGDFSDARGASRQSLVEPGRMEFRRLFSARVRPAKARFARITLTGLQEVNGRRILGLGEIALYRPDGRLVRGANVSINGLQEAFGEQLSLLQDGYSWGRRILSEMEWIKGLAERRSLDLRLAEVKRELNQSRRTLRSMQAQAVYAGGAVMVVLFLGGMILQRRKRRRMLHRLGERITRDLHDEVGSSLGSITLMADDLSESVKTTELRKDLNELSLMAREANASLREVVWGGDRGSARLPELLKAFQERIERVMRNVDLKISFPEDCPDLEVSLEVKRHLVMFFKEAVNNCARHSGASEVELDASVLGEHLRIRLRDNGCGFDLSSPSSGWGLRNLSKRAEELGGEVAIRSEVAKGTDIVLQVPLSMLADKPTQSYETSN